MDDWTIVDFIMIFRGKKVIGYVTSEDEAQEICNTNKKLKYKPMNLQQRERYLDILPFLTNF